MTTLHDRINRIAHVVINVSDLERSRRFYEDVLDLAVSGEIAAPTQAFAGLGIARGRFEGLVMRDRTGGSPTAIHLVRWIDPAPAGRPYPTFWNVGLAKVALLIPDLEAKLELMRGLGLASANPVIQRRYLTLLDPDGTIISLPEHRQLRGSQLMHVNVSARDVGVSNRFYGELLGLPKRLEHVPSEPQPVSHGPGSDRAQWDSHHFSSRGDRRFNIDVSQFHFPAPTAQTLTPYAEANHLGIVRVGFEVDDLARARGVLVEALGDGAVGPPEVWDYGPGLGTERVVTFKDPDGIRLELVEAKGFAPPPPLQRGDVAAVRSEG
jgi:catechol 2,3-dioxygenase-like lactoylglutathione lyase family enzyme